MTTIFKLFFFSIFFLQFSFCRKIDFSGLIKCQKPDWCYKIVYWEEDNYEDDFVFETRRHCSKKSNLTNSVIAEHGWDGSLHYEFYMMITHNCTSSGNNQTFRYNLPDYPAMETVNVRYQLDITDQ